MGQTGIDFTENEFSSARHINYLSSQLKLKGMVEAQTGKTQLDCLHTQRERRKLDPSWNDASRKRQDVIQLLSGNLNSPIFRVLICKLICGWQRQAWVWKRILDVIWCLSTSSLGDWSLIGNEGTAFSLWGSQGVTAPTQTANSVSHNWSKTGHTKMASRQMFTLFVKFKKKYDFNFSDMQSFHKQAAE